MLMHLLFEQAVPAIPTIAPVTPEIDSAIVENAPEVAKAINDAIPQIVGAINEGIPALNEAISEGLPLVANAIEFFAGLSILCICFVLLFRILLHVVWGLFSRSIAKSKGYTGGFWWGFFLGTLGMLFVALRPDKNLTAAIDRLNDTVARLQNNETTREASSAGTPYTEGMNRCAHCGAQNERFAKYCSECGKDLREI
ncbi:MAG: zinc ribbon domain-containing protein [Clostridia bacterium]|nr:zinc ribbon domain-containing protein [Clostridia bacterium]